MNAEKELREKLEEIGKNELDIRCALISLYFDFFDDDEARRFDEDEESDRKLIILTENYDQSDLIDFFHNLDVDYSDGFGGQELFGKVFFTDGSWLERGEYDGSEWWEYKKSEIPELCRTGMKKESFLSKLDALLREYFKNNPYYVNINYKTNIKRGSQTSINALVSTYQIADFD